MPRPLFIFGIARSGTNLVTGMLNAHSRVALAFDPLMPFFKSLRDSWIKTTNDFTLQSRYPAGCAHQDYYFDPQSVRLLDLTMTGDLNAEADQPELMSRIIARAALESPQFAQGLRDKKISGTGFRDILDGILSQIIPDNADRYQWHGTKEVWTSEYIPPLARAYPDARFILVRRDPRGVLASLQQLAQRDPSQAAHTISYMRHWRKEVAITESLRADPHLCERILLVRYEDLAQHPHQGMEQLASFLGIAPEPGMLHPVMGAGGGLHGNSSYADFAGISTASVARWRNVLEPALRQTIEFICGPEMLAAGYLEPETQSPATVTVDLLRLFEAADREPGSWRSDTGTPEKQIADETLRWTWLTKPSAVTENPAELRRHFLFLPFYHRLRNLCQSAGWSCNN